MNSFAKQSVLNACRMHCEALQLPSDLDKYKVMAAIASNESSTGLNCGPRHEPAYDTGGSLSHTPQQAELLAKYGSAAACSYGPWQMMFGNFSGHTPDELLTNLDVCASEFVRFFNHYVIGVRHAKTLSDIGQVWNSGHVSATPSAGVAAYVTKLQTAYDAA